jgi:hypothetical protein
MLGGRGKNSDSDRAKALDLAGIGYTSHNHKPSDIRYRLVFPVTGWNEIKQFTARKGPWN